jgi:hypothetical protein
MGRHVGLQRIVFTSYGLIQLLPGEHRELVLEEAELQPADDCSIGPDGEDITGTRGRLEVTTQRLTWIESGSNADDPKRSCSLPIVALQSATMSTGSLFLVTAQSICLQLLTPSALAASVLKTLLFSSTS